MSAAKDTLNYILHQQPEDATEEEILRELRFHIMIERGLADSDAGRTIPHDEVVRRIKLWGA